MRAIINGKEIPLGGGTNGLPVKALSLSEYEALSDEERAADVVYVVTDDNVDEEENYETYNTEETRIGTWIDGKPLYRKVFTATVPSESKTVLSETVIQNVDFVSKCGGTVKTSSGSYFNTPYDNSGTIQIFYQGGSSQGICIANTVSGYVGQPIVIVLEYTKTTD